MLLGEWKLAASSDHGFQPRENVERSAAKSDGGVVQGI